MLRPLAQGKAWICMGEESNCLGYIIYLVTISDSIPDPGCSVAPMSWGFFFLQKNTRWRFLVHIIYETKYIYMIHVIKNLLGAFGEK